MASHSWPMIGPSRLYREPLGLLTDLYQLTMAFGYWKLHRAGHEAAFHLFFRHNPFGGGYAIACGLEYVVDYVHAFRFMPDDLEYLALLSGNDGKPLFSPGFLDYLGTMRFEGNVDAVPEGTVVFPHEPLLRVTGPIAQCQLLETPLLNMVNFQTLIATKASRVCTAARGEPVLEFGLRRAQGVDGAVAASRAAFVGGCAATSNVLAGKLFGIPVRGTHAHSWVLSFDDEAEAIDAYAQAMPNNCVFLVDTYDTLSGVRLAINAGRKLRSRGYEMAGIRLDSGDLAYLSIQARKMLDAAGFQDAFIVGSNDLDERVIESLKQQGAKIAVWGVGTRLVTAHDQPALGGVYKLTAVRTPGTAWQHKLKLSEQAVKTSTPGILQIRRFRTREGCVADMVFDELSGVSDTSRVIDPVDPTRSKPIPENAEFEDLLIPVVRHGRTVYEGVPLAAVRREAGQSLSGFHRGIRRHLNPHEYPVGLELGLHELKTELTLKARRG